MSVLARSTRRLAFVAAGAVTLVTLGLGSPAHAAVYQPWKNSANNVVGAYSKELASRTSSTITLQRSRWYGWQDLAKVTVYGPITTTNVVSWYCGGSGTHTYRVVDRKVNALNQVSYEFSATARISC